MQNVADQVDRLKKVFRVKTDVALAERLGKDKNTVSVWRRRKSIPLDVFRKVSVDESVSIDWLVSGVGSMELQSAEQTLNEISLISGLLSDNRSVKIVELLPYAPKEFIDQVISRLEEFKRLTQL
jgi:hypothetical protein